MSLNPNDQKGENVRQRSTCSFININTGDSEFEGNIKFIGQLQNSPNPPDDKPEPSYGKRVVDIRKYIHQQLREKKAGTKKLSDWWALMKDVSNAMSTMDFNFNFKNAVQLRTYNQLKNAEKKLKKELERKMADVSDRLEKLGQDLVTVLLVCCMTRNCNCSQHTNFSLFYSYTRDWTLEAATNQIAAFLEKATF